MANPRNILRFEGINGEYATYMVDDDTIQYELTRPGGSRSVGRAVTLIGNATVALAGDGQSVLGRLTLVEPDGKCNIQTGGYMLLPAGTGAVLTAGARCVGDLGGEGDAEPGFVRAAGTNTEASATDARIIDASNTAQVAVRI